MEKVVNIIKKLAIPIILLIIIIGVFIGIVNFQSNTSNPEVVITEPEEGFTTDKESIIVKGETDNLNNEIFVNDIQAEISGDKTFQAKVPLSEGDNEIRIEIVTRSGRQITQNITGEKTGETVPKDGEEKTPDKEILGGSPSTPETAPSGKASETPLTKAGPKENAIAGFGIVCVMLYFYFQSKKALVNSRR